MLEATSLLNAAMLRVRGWGWEAGGMESEETTMDRHC